MHLHECRIDTGCRGRFDIGARGTLVARIQRTACSLSLACCGRRESCGCPDASHWNAHYAVCEPNPAGPPRGQHASGSLRFVRAPLVQLFAAEHVLWVTYRLNRRPRGFVTTMLDDTAVIAQSMAGLGYDRSSRRGNCYAQSVDPESFGRSLRHPRVGQKVRVELRVDDRSRSRIVISTRIRQHLPRDSTDIGGWGWMEALGCPSGLTIGP